MMTSFAAAGDEIAKNDEMSCGWYTDRTKEKSRDFFPSAKNKNAVRDIDGRSVIDIFFDLIVICLLVDSVCFRAKGKREMLNHKKVKGGRVEHVDAKTNLQRNIRIMWELLHYKGRKVLVWA